MVWHVPTIGRTHRLYFVGRCVLVIGQYFDRRAVFCLGLACAVLVLGFVGVDGLVDALEIDGNPAFQKVLNSKNLLTVVLDKMFYPCICLLGIENLTCATAVCRGVEEEWNGRYGENEK